MFQHYNALYRALTQEYRCRAWTRSVNVVNGVNTVEVTYTFPEGLEPLSVAQYRTLLEAVLGVAMSPRCPEVKDFAAAGSTITFRLDVV